MRYFLGIEISRLSRSIFISTKACLDLFNETEILECKPANTPIDQNYKLMTNDKAPIDHERYQRLVEMLIYLFHTRPNIIFAVSIFSQFMHDPRERYMETVYRVLCNCNTHSIYQLQLAVDA